MQRLRQYLGFSLFLFGTLPTHAQTGGYTFKKEDPNGIGKWYMGREIAHVMGVAGMYWLERPERELEERASLLFENMNIQPEDKIADIGAGSGYHVFRMAEQAKAGMIYAIDIQDEMLAVLEQKKNVGNHRNVSVIKGSIKNTNLPKNIFDKVLIVDVYHEMSYPIEVMQTVFQAMKPNGKLYLIEYRGEDPKVPIKRLHKMTEAQAVKEMKSMGFQLEENIGNLPWQHCMVFVNH